MAPADPYNLARFLIAQIPPPKSKLVPYSTALDEIRHGRKTSHWIWYVLPQAEGLSDSLMGRKYGIRSLMEARAYLRQPVLHNRLIAILHAILASQTKTARELMGSAVDEEKLQASLTLFLRADPKQQIFTWSTILDKYFTGRVHDATDAMLARWEADGRVEREKERERRRVGDVDEEENERGGGGGEEDDDGDGEERGMGMGMGRRVYAMGG